MVCASKMASNCEPNTKAPRPTFPHQIPTPPLKKKKKIFIKNSSLHLVHLFNIDTDTQQHPEMWCHVVSDKNKATKLKVVLS